MNNIINNVIFAVVLLGFTTPLMYYIHTEEMAKMTATTTIQYVNYNTNPVVIYKGERMKDCAFVAPPCHQTAFGFDNAETIILPLP